ncbi:glycosyltransferase [Massilimicrobiota timonensis]|uniref:Glycosyltransferase n=1 Tax=Massilimicrobiota timonensis TaxID=1776392 RepID=A0ABT7UKQ9_9FIRM|nr:glycosyltransferase [Massilimicrobiota timonensis]MDM8196706.1 glycosyltransferase [Massilimicrobiota timonensis]
MKTKILMLRTNKVDPDPRVEKEASSLIKNKNYEVFIHAWDRNGKYKCRKEELELPNGKVPIYRIGIPGNWGKGMKNNIFPALKYEISLFFWLLKNIKNYDCIHACDLMTGYPALLPVKIFKKKLIYDCCDYYADSQHGPNFIMNLLKNMETKVIESADATILCSEKRIEQIKPAIPKKVVYVHNSPNLEDFNIDNTNRRVCKSNTTKFKLVYVGNFCVDRWLIELLKSVEKMPSVELHIGGFGDYLDEIERIASKNNNIYTYGKMKYEDVLILENECDCLVALYETHLKNHIYAAPNKFYEALAIGKPLLMLKNSGMSEVVSAEKIGAVMEPNFESFEKSIFEIKKLIERDQTLKSRMINIFNEKYNWKIMENRIFELYREVLKS